MDPRLIHRMNDIAEWLRDDPCMHEQKHLDADSRERVYWHYGYMVALRDVLGLDKSESLTEYHRRLFGNRD